METGMVPFRGLSTTHNTLRNLQFVKEVMKLSSDSEDEDAPVKLFFPKFRYSRSFKLPSEFGIGPLNLLEMRSRLASLEALEIESGITPVRVLEPK